LRLGDFQDDGSQYVLRFQEIRWKIARNSRAARLGTFYHRVCRGGDRGGREGLTVVPGIKRADEAADGQAAVQQANLRAGQAAAERCRQYLAGHTEPRTTGLYDRRQKKVMRNIVERISI
jgi:hypothetical protein